MKLIESMQEILLAFSIAIIIPAIVYWGVQAFYPMLNTHHVVGYNAPSKDVQQDIEASTLEQTQEELNMELETKHWNTSRLIGFWAYLVCGILAIVIGSYIHVNSLSLGLIGGGAINLLLVVLNSPHSAIINVSVFLFLFGALILISMKRRL